ncbi:hypothetical protein FHW12_002049 [Dokdonella fugitiva]|uniref:Yip1-like protein n=1 Tax=Dokdonella fugitiva TaxID=328517 RepID=A0A839EVQ5_9GAMM|nr:hypothetical protein [Dokdonella fugitiva]MBA8887835.1 hypothetical protein [Dokdonella fugitiva]
MDERHDSLFARVLGLCLLRTAPQDLPHAPALVAGFGVAGVALATVVGAAVGEADDLLPRALLSTAVLLGSSAIALAVRRLGHRWVQTATALLASDFVMSLVQTPFLLAMLPITDPPTATQALLGWVLVLTFFWQLGVNAHIMRHAMDAGFGFALVLVATWAIANWSLAHLLLGG